MTRSTSASSHPFWEERNPRATQSREGRGKRRNGMKRHAMSRRKVRGPTFSSRPLEAAWLSLCFSSACSAASRIWWASLLARRSASAFFRASSICWLQTARFHQTQRRENSRDLAEIPTKTSMPSLASRGWGLTELMHSRKRYAFDCALAYRVSRLENLALPRACFRWGPKPLDLGFSTESPGGPGQNSPQG